MTDINKLLIIGRLTRDMDLRFTNSGTPVGKFSIATNRSRKNGDNWEDEVNYFDCTLWGKIAESLLQYLLKGQQVAIEGELRQSRWEQDGQKRSRVEIHINNIQLLGGKKDNNQNTSPQQNTGQNDYHNFTEDDQFQDDIPF